VLIAAGLLQLLRRDPDLLAMVMGHEIAHALARHNTGRGTHSRQHTITNHNASAWLLQQQRMHPLSKKQ
jgi:predicted Zn-dependent protease